VTYTGTKLNQNQDDSTNLVWFCQNELEWGWSSSLVAATCGQMERHGESNGGEFETLVHA